MANPYDNLPLPSANEYPYNLQGDQTKARALANAAQMGSGSALEKLKTLGLDSSGGLQAYSPTQPVPSTVPLPQQQFEEANKDDDRNFAENKRRFDEQTSMARQRMNFEQQMAERKMQMAEKQANQQRVSQGGGGGRGGGGGGGQQKPQAQQKPPTRGKAPAGRGGGGGGGGGGKGSQTPEQKAREKGRLERATDRQNRRTDRTQERRDNEEYAKSQGYNNARAMEDAQKSKKFFDESRERNKQQAEAKKAAAEQNAQANSSKSAPEALGNKPGAKNPSTERYTVPDGQGGTKTVDGYGNEVQNQPKMTHAYGNKHAKMVRARGDLG